MRGGGFPGRAAQGLSLLLYSPGSHGGHIKWPPARAELATKGIPSCARRRIPGPGIRLARRGNVTCQKGTSLFWQVLSGETSRSSGKLPSPVSWRSTAFSEVCGKFWTCRAHRGFAITNPQVERLGTCGVVGLSGFCRILPESRRSRCLPHFRSAGKNWKPLTRPLFLTTKPQVSRGHNIGVVEDSAFFPALPKSASK